VIDRQAYRLFAIVAVVPVLASIGAVLWTSSGDSQDRFLSVSLSSAVIILTSKIRHVPVVAERLGFRGVKRCSGAGLNVRGPIELPFGNEREGNIISVMERRT
jgi:hypothetical protein